MKYCKFSLMIAIIAILLISSCKKDKEENAKIGEGQFTYSGQTINGDCSSIPATSTSCTGIDVVILNSDIDEVFIIYNMPTASTGSFNVGDEIGSCNIFAITSLGENAISRAGTITKTGAKSFTFKIIFEIFASGVKQEAIGKGNWDS